MPVIVRELDDNSAVLVMVDSNLEQQEKILPSERAAAYSMMMDALKHNGVRGDNHSYEIMVERTGESKNQIFRIIRVTELIVTLKQGLYQMLRGGLFLTYLFQVASAKVFYS
jgi:ParB family chromosome partitioning protein